MSGVLRITVLLVPCWQAPWPSARGCPAPPVGVPPSCASSLDPGGFNAGPLPLVHLFDQGGPIRILNVTTKQTLLDTIVPPGSIISVTDSGILIGRTRRLTTRLDPKHRYELWWDVAKQR